MKMKMLEFQRRDVLKISGKRNLSIFSKELTSSSASDDEAPEQSAPHKKKRVKKIYENAEARSQREQAEERLQEQAERRKKLQAKLAKAEGGGRIIVNDAAAEDEVHYIAPNIADQIKKHQIDGVRFMWNQVVAGVNEDAMQGCLLAHTMGLGKVRIAIASFAPFNPLLRLWH